MRRKSVTFTCLSLLGLVALLAGCGGFWSKSDESDFESPLIALDHVEVPYYTGYYYFGNTVEPTKGNRGNYGSPMMLAFVFEIENPNDTPVLLDGFEFTVLFDGIEVNMVNSPESMWIPAGKTNQLRVPAMFDTRQTFLTLLLPGAATLKETKMSPWDALKKWWAGAPDFSFPIAVQAGSAVFQADGVTRVVPFSALYP